MRTCLSAITHYSCLESCLSPKKLIAAAIELGYDSLGIADIGIMSGTMEFYLECKKTGIKPILGMRYDNHVCLAKNKAGYFELVQLCYDVNSGLAPDLREFESKNTIFIPENSDKYHVPSPRYLEGQKVLHDILVATREHAKLDKIGPLLDTYKDDWFGNHKKSDSERLVAEIEEYDITSKPILPLYEGREDNSALFRRLCEKQLVAEFGDNQVYRDRLEEELRVLQGAKLENYFLILKDILDYARTKYLLGPARGSSAGCLVSYLLGITQIDPLKHNLIFSRFYSDARNTKDNISLPDIDCDFPQRSRSDLIQYTINKYGEDKVSKIGTYSTLMGRSALSAVFRATSNLGFAELKKITKIIKDKAAISDDLQEMAEAGKKKSVIMWGLENESSRLKDYCEFKNGELTGQYAEQFRLAIDLEETKCALSEHAAGIVITRSSLRDCCPMTRNHDYLITGCEIDELKEYGINKYDYLGISTLDKLEDI